VLPLVAPLPELLARRRREQLTERLRASGWGPDLGLVFTATSGRPLDPSDLRQAQSRHLKAATAADVTLHRFRHGVATLLLEHDAPARIIQALLGHSGKSVSDRYQHPTVASLRPYAERIAGHFQAETLTKVWSNPAINQSDGAP